MPAEHGSFQLPSALRRPAARPTRFVVLSQPRTGSSLLCGSIRWHPQLAVTYESLRDHLQSTVEMVLRFIGVKPMPLDPCATRNETRPLDQVIVNYAVRFTHAPFTAHGVGVEPDGFRDAGGLKRKIDCNAVYKLLDEALWWPLLAGKRLAIVSNHADEVAARLTGESFVQAHGGASVRWSIEARVVCPPKSVPKRDHWPRMRDELFAAEWDLLLCSAGSLSALLCEHARQAGRAALDIGALDAKLLADGVRPRICGP